MLVRDMSTGSISFLTPYWSGREMMHIHLESIRRFYPEAPILVSKRGGGREEMEAHRNQFGIRFWLDDCEYMDAYLRLLERCKTDYACILDHDVVLLAGLDGLLEGLAAGRYDLVGVEERIREPEALAGTWPQLHANGWMRFAPGCTAANFLLFHWRSFAARWGLRGVIGERVRGARSYEFDYGIGQKLLRHRYLQPFHTRRYGLGNLLKDGDATIAWHQWFGSYRTRMLAGATHPDRSAMFATVEMGERAFLEDYPALELSSLVPAWGPELDIDAERSAVYREHRFAPGEFVARAVRTLRRWRDYGWRGILARSSAWIGRWWRLR
jgi:hypothetical protein